MIIKPLLPDAEPQSANTKFSPTLPFRPTTDFYELLQSRMKGQPNPAPASHIVQKGESLWRICEEALESRGTKPTRNAINEAVHRVTAANKLRNPNALAVGQTLDISPLHRSETARAVASGNFQASVAPATPEKPAVVAEAARPVSATLSNRDARGGASSPARPLFGRLSNARPLVHVHPHPARNVETAADPQPPSVDLTALMQSILEPGSVAVETASPASPWKSLLAGAGRFTSGFGLRNDPFSGKRQFHQGIDIAAAAGTEIYPYMPGTVKSAGWNGGHGNAVIIEHPNGLETLYAHASETLVKAGDVVFKDTPIAKVGTTGRSTGPHLHFEVRQNDKPIDPLPFVTNPSFNVAKTL